MLQMIQMGIFKYICSLALIFVLSFSYGQDEEIYVPVKEKEPIKLKGITLGANIGRFADYIFKPERESYEGSLSINLSNKYFGVIEGGYSEIDLVHNKYNYISYGSFARIGIESNMLKKYPSDFLGIGLKLGRAEFRHQATNVLINAPRWESNINIPKLEYITYWVEASLGVKGEVFKNVYLGWSGIVRVKVSGGEDSNFLIYDIPGFGNGTKTINLGINYYIYYQIPFNRK